MRSTSLLWRKVERPVLLLLVLICSLAVWGGLYWIFRGILILGSKFLSVAMSLLRTSI